MGTVELWEYNKRNQVHQIRVTDASNEMRVRFTDGDNLVWSEWITHDYGNDRYQFRDRQECIEIIEFAGYQRLS